MNTSSHLPIPVLSVLRKMGKDISEARRRRRISVELMAERAGLSRSTISRIEKGDPTTSIGGYAAVLFVLGMVSNLGLLVDTARDLIGRRLEDERLPQRVRLPRNKKQGTDHE